MEDRSKLIEKLMIDRDTEETSSPSRWPLWSAISAVVVLGIAVVWLLLRDQPGAQTAAASATQESTSAIENSVPKSASLLDASGYVVARRKATVSATINGRVVDVLISEGTQVKQGDVLARLDDGPYRLMLAQAKAQLESSQAQLHAAEIAFSNAEPTYKRVQKQQAAGYLSAQVLDDAKTAYDSASTTLEIQRRAVDLAHAQVAIAERNLTDTVVHAPFAGVVTDKISQPGEIVSPGAAGGSIRTGIGTIVDMESLEVEVDVSENFINRVTPKQPATVKLNAYPDWEIPAEVIAVIPTADRSKATVKVRVGFKEHDARILPDMGARVAFLEAKANGT